MQGAKRAAAERGELRFPLPVGYVRDADGATIVDPDQEVSAAVAHVFAAFQATGSAYGVVGAFASRRFPLRIYGGVWAAELRWGRLTHSRVLSILSNPTYAGAYVFGRYRRQRIVAADGSIRDTMREQPRSDWAVVIQSHHLGYISWEQYLLNQQRLAANATRSGASPPREGVALCQGIVHCGSCGRTMSTEYQANGRAFYDCSDSRGDHVRTKACRSVGAAMVDQIVSSRLLQVLGPDELALALAAAEEVTERRRQSTRASELALERARYDADRAERALLACEPENRLVARSLESRWEAKLAAVAEAEAALAVIKASMPPLPPRAELEALATDLPALWAAPSTSARDRKRLMRTLVADVTLTSQLANDEVSIGIRWRSGASDQIVTRRPPRLYELVRTPSNAVNFIVQRGSTLTNQELVAELNAAGMRTGMGRLFDIPAVQWLRHVHRVPSPSPLQPGELSVNGFAARLGVSMSAVYYWIEHGKLAARRTTTGRLCITNIPEVEAVCHKLMAESRHMQVAQQGMGAEAV
jgi:recombinase/recombinase-like zinc beta ribbon protein